jgi:aminoglycoside phosphotransferase (APT) family kinase protein
MPSLPVPKILAYDFDPQNAVGAPFSILEKMEGEGHWSAWPKLSPQEKVKLCPYLHYTFYDLINVLGKPCRVLCRSHGTDL